MTLYCVTLYSRQPCTSLFTFAAAAWSLPPLVGHGAGCREIGNLLPNNRRQRRTCYALCHILYPVSAAQTSIFRMDSNSTSYCRVSIRFRPGSLASGGWVLKTIKYLSRTRCSRASLRCACSATAALPVQCTLRLCYHKFCVRLACTGGVRPLASTWGLANAHTHRPFKSS